MSRVRNVVVFLVLAAVAVCAQVPAPPEFSADMTATSKTDRGMKGKMYMGGGKMRMDMTTEGGKMSMITLPAKKMSYMVMHDQQMYMEISTEGGMGAMNPMGRGPKMPDVKALSDNPCAGRPGVTCKMAGAEMMNGRMCDKWEFASSNKSEAGTVWIDQKTRWPIKSVHNDGSTMEFTNFKEGPQDASLFAPPSGYQKFDMGGMMRRQ
ncbi:MAG TPA: DUF4412 domain-containing protein [Terriglobales bacterium]|nr:DUF4412 domain-containing protein [Terriglobales bacterium]